MLNVYYLFKIISSKKVPTINRETSCNFINISGLFLKFYRPVTSNFSLLFSIKVTCKYYWEILIKVLIIIFPFLSMLSLTNDRAAYLIDYIFISSSSFEMKTFGSYFHNFSCALVIRVYWKRVSIKLGNISLKSGFKDDLAWKQQISSTICMIRPSKSFIYSFSWSWYSYSTSFSA